MSATTVAFIAPEADAGTMPLNGVRTVTGKHNPRSFTSPDGVVYELVYVTPDAARRWLYRNNGNRVLRKEVVAKLARDLKAGRFVENGDAIRVSVEGDLADGQHRLHAVVESGVSVWMLVVSNLPAAARDTVDDGVKRTMADRFTFHGEASPKTLAAVVRRAILWHSNHVYNSGRVQASTAESFQFLADHPEIRDAAAAADHYAKRTKLRASMVGLCWWLFDALDHDQCEAFFERLADGAQLNKGDAILTLRDRLAELAAAPGSSSEAHLLAYVIKAWNYYRADKPLQSLRFAENEKFPTPK